MRLRSVIVMIMLAAGLPASAQSQSQPDWSNAATAEVTLQSFSFTPERLNLKAGMPTRLTLRDEKGGHSFAAAAFFAAARIAPEDRVKLVNGKVELKGGEAVTIRLIPVAGTYKMTCTHFMHSTFGMKGMIVVD